jgi:hypothetical protein
MANIRQMLVCSSYSEFTKAVNYLNSAQMFNSFHFSRRFREPPVRPTADSTFRHDSFSKNEKGCFDHGRQTNGIYPINKSALQIRIHTMESVNLTH